MANLTKKLNFTPEVLQVVQDMDWSPDGLLGKITTQLNRTQYVAVNKALETMGGKWNKKQAGHVFAFDPRSQVEGLLVSGQLTVERDGFFETPLAVVNRMMELVTPHGNILEPSAGMGAIADNLGVSKSSILCIEKNALRGQALAQKGYKVIETDFLTWQPTANNFDTVFMNPPFEANQDIAHVQHAFTMLRNGGQLVSVVSEHPFFANDKASVAFREWLDSVGAYEEKLPEGSFKSSGTGVNARLVVIQKAVDQS